MEFMNEKDDRNTKTQLISDENNDEDVNLSRVFDKDEEEDILDDHFSSSEVTSPGGHSFWIPRVSASVAIDENKVFDTLSRAIDYYKEYSVKAGFDARVGSSKYEEGVLCYKYVFCSRAGEADKRNVDTLKGDKGKQKRKRPSQMKCCPARICLKVLKYGTFRYFINKFEEKHNHELYTNLTAHMSRTRRQLDFYDETLLLQLSKKNIGATTAYNIMTCLMGGDEGTGPKFSDYKNFIRDLNFYIKDTDANMLINLLVERTEIDTDFSIYYMLEDNELRALYNLVFVPFTGIDNHKKSITFGAGLMAKETTEYYTWLLESFIKSFGKQPSIVVTDQDATIGQAVEKVLTESKRCLCMWHFNKKLTDKVVAKVIQGTHFKKRLSSLIWNNCIEPNEFEDKWTSLIAEFNLESNKWLTEMFSLQFKWIPAYFKDNPMSGLMRTISRSESENYFFKNYFSKDSNLLAFMYKFDAAMDKQRSKQATNDFNSSSKTIASNTRLAFEVQASNFYTHQIFRSFQKEIHDCVWACSPGLVVSFEEHNSCLVVEQALNEDGENQSSFFNPHAGAMEVHYHVDVYKSRETLKCSCMVFEQHGILCRHVLCIMKKRFMKKIPDKYLLRRWQKDIILPVELKKRYATSQSSGSSDKLIQKAYSVFGECLNIISHDADAVKKFVKWKMEIKDKIIASPPEKEVRTRAEKFNSTLGVSKPATTEIRNPQNVRNNGCGSSKRLKGQREIAMKKGKTV